MEERFEGSPLLEGSQYPLKRGEEIERYLSLFNRKGDEMRQEKNKRNFFIP